MHDATHQLPFEISAVTDDDSVYFIPFYYPENFRQVKDRELNRSGKGCEGENVSLKKLKNREFHTKGIALQQELDALNTLLDWEHEVNVYSPLTPNGGMECEIKNAELGDIRGWDPVHDQWQFEYTLDLVSSGRDEYDSGNNVIVSAIIEDIPEQS